jgi:hypothetical protein
VGPVYAGNALGRNGSPRAPKMQQKRRRKALERCLSVAWGLLLIVTARVASTSGAVRAVMPAGWQRSKSQGRPGLGAGTVRSREYGELRRPGRLRNGRNCKLIVVTPGKSAVGYMPSQVMKPRALRRRSGRLAASIRLADPRTVTKKTGARQGKPEAREGYSYSGYLYKLCHARGREPGEDEKANASR